MCVSFNSLSWCLNLVNLLKTLFLCIGIIRLVQYLSQSHLLGKQRAVKLVVDAGTGTTAVGIGLAALCLGCGSVCSMLVYLKIFLDSFPMTIHV